MARTRLYRHGSLEAEGFPAERISDHLSDPDAVIWLDLCQPTEQELSAIAEELGLHRLAVEGALESRQRSKLDRYSDHSLLTTYAVRVNQDSGLPETFEVAVLFTRQVLVTVRKSADFDIDAVVERWDTMSELASGGVAFLLHGVLDWVVDGYFDAVTALDEDLDDLEEMVFVDELDNPDTQRRTLRLRKAVGTVRRVALPVGEIVVTLKHHVPHLEVDETLMPYYQDVYDHVLRVTESAETQLDHIATIRETQLNLHNNRLNTIMKKVTSWAAIIAVPTAITGFYGQNLPYPGLQQEWGVWTSTIAILSGSGVLYLMFKRRDWL